MTPRHLLPLLLAAAACTTAPPPTRTPQPADSLYTEAAAMAVHEKYPDEALRRIDSAEALGRLADFRASLLRAQVFSYTAEQQRQDTARQICEALLRHDSVRRQPALQRQVLQVLTNASRMRHDDEQWLHWASRLAALCRQLGDRTEALRTDAEVGLVLTHLGREHEGYRHMDAAIRQLAGEHTFRGLDAGIIAMKRKIVALSEGQHHADILPVATLILQRLDDYRCHAARYHGLGQLSAADRQRRDDYIDFYGAQANAFMAEAHAHLGDTAAARSALRRFRQTRYGHTLDGRRMSAPTLLLLGEYTQMLDICDEVQRLLVRQQDTLRNDYADILRARALAAEAQGQLRQSIRYWKQYSQLRRVLSRRLQRSEAHLYAAIYHAQEQEMTIQRQQATATRNGIIAAGAVMALLAALAVAVYQLRQKRIIDRKNRILVQQITENIAYKTAAYTMTPEETPHIRLADSGPTPERPTPERPTPDPSRQGGVSWRKAIPLQAGGLPSLTGEVGGGSSLPLCAEGAEVETAIHGSPVHDVNLGTLTDEQLFRYLSSEIMRQKLFLNPVCDRKTIMDRFQLSEKRVGAAFAKGSRYKSLPSFIRDCRLEYACRLLRERPDMTIGQVASTAGFSNHTRFTADFKQRYSVSPTEFRSLA